MNYINDYTTPVNILADFVESVCWKGGVETDNWFLSHPVAESKEEALDLVLQSGKATLTTMYAPDREWTKNELFTTSPSMVEGEFLEIKLTDPLSIDAQMSIEVGEKKMAYYRTINKEAMGTQEFYVDYSKNSAFLLMSNFPNGFGTKILVSYEAFSNDTTRWYVELDYTNEDKNYFSYRIGKEIDSEGRIVNKKKTPPESRVYWHSPNKETLPLEDWLPIEYFITWDYKSINFVFCEDPVYQEDVIHGWGYIGALEELKESVVTDFKGNFGAVGTYGFDERDHTASNALLPTHLVMFESHSGRPYPYYEIGTYYEYEFGGKTGLQGHSGHTGRYSSSKMVAAEKHENERGYLRNVVATSKYGKSHKDPFVKFKEDNEKETPFIYLDLLGRSKTLFANSNNTMSSIALQLEEIGVPLLGTISFKSVDIDTEEVLESSLFEQVSSAEKRVPELIVRGDGDTREEFLLIGEDYFKHIIYRDGETKEHVFQYSQRYGDFTFNFISSADIPEILQAPVLYEKRVSVTHNNKDERIFTEGGLKRYKLAGEANVTLSAASPKDDKEHNYIYDLMRVGLKSQYRDAQDLSIEAAPDIDHGMEPFHKITPPATIGPDEDGLNKYHLSSHPVGEEITIYSKEGVSEETIRFLYELVRSTFIFNYINQDTVVIAEQEVYENKNSIEKTPPLIIHDENVQDDDEYYELDSSETTPVFLIADESKPVQSVDFHYNRITGDITFRYMDDFGDDFISSTDHLGIPSATVTAPVLYSESSNVYYQLLDDEENPVRLIVTPEEREIEHIFNYTKEIMPATLKINIDTPCQFRKGMTYVLYEEEVDGSGTVVMVLDQMGQQSSGTYQKTFENLTAEVEFEDAYDEIEKANRLKWNCNIMSDAYSNPIDKTLKIGAINTLTNEHICDYGFINYIGYEVGGSQIEAKKTRKLAHAVSYADWRAGTTPVVGMKINTGGNPKEYPNVCEIATIDQNEYLVDQTYSLNTQHTVEV